MAFQLRLLQRQEPLVAARAGQRSGVGAAEARMHEASGRGPSVDTPSESVPMTNRRMPQLQPDIVLIHQQDRHAHLSRGCTQSIQCPGQGLFSLPGHGEVGDGMADLGAVRASRQSGSLDPIRLGHNAARPASMSLAAFACIPEDRRAAWTSPRVPPSSAHLGSSAARSGCPTDVGVHVGRDIQPFRFRAWSIKARAAAASRQRCAGPAFR